ncbi:MAG TPA: LamG domain-containing protein [Sedimentisphaerales bacterium]|nr:LamG domain-containing protein [Sedimentisphaerales bacterium]
MSKKLISFVLVLSLAAGIANADMVGYWKFDEGSGNIAYDLSNYTNHGTINGDPKWVIGKIGAALEFDGSDDYVDCGNDPSLNINDRITVAAWVKTTSTAHGYFVSKGTAWEETGHYAIGQEYNVPMTFQFEIAGSGGTVELDSNVAVNDGDWHYIVGTYDDPVVRVYIDGVEENSATGTNRLTDSAVGGLTIGQRGGNIISGTIDEVRIYNQALTESEILAAMEGGEGYPYALGPNPADGAYYEDTWTNLSWRPGDFSLSHDVYFGDNFVDVNNGAEGTFLGNQGSTYFIVGFPGFAYPDGLVPGATYYWRIDEVNDAEPNSPWKGSVWNFTIPPRIAYNPIPADGDQSINPNDDLTWTPGFGAVLNYVYFGDNFNDVNNAAGSMPWGTSTYDPGPLELSKTYYWRVDEFDTISTHKGNVWSFTTEGGVETLNPSNGAVDITQTPILTWVPSVYAASHQIYFGPDAEAVKNADTGSPEYKGTRVLGAESFEPEKLEWDSTYYWRIDEVNNTNPDSPWIGPVWSFRTANFLIVDDFESYNDLEPADPDSNRIFNAWIDGYDDPANGSLVGYETPPFAEQTIVHSSNQSLPLYYDNSVGYSEATLTLTYPRDWTEKGVTTLTIWFRGDSANAAETLYVALNGSAIVTNDNPNAAQVTTWTEWNIDLLAFADQGVNLANVNTIALGLGDKNNPLAGGSGTMYFDDIRLYPPAP